MAPIDTRRRLVRIGAFAVIGFALFAVGLFLIGDRRLLFADQYELQTGFTRVSGLQVGTAVRVAGMNAGEVTLIEVPLRPSEPFTVRMRVLQTLAPLVRTDSVATIQVDGIVGNAFIQIARGSDAAAIAPPGSRIPGRDPTEFSDVLVEATETLAAFRGMVDQVSDDVEETLVDLDQTVKTVNSVLEGVDQGVDTVTDHAQRIMSQVDGVVLETRSLVEGVNRGEGTVGKLLKDDGLYADMRAVADRAGQVADHVRGATAQTRDALDRLLARDGPAEGVLTELRSAGAAAEELLADLAENAEALKRNFLLRGFFERRGYFDIDAFTPLEYRRFADDEEDRTVLRIWLQSDVLFSQTGDEEQLTPDGRARLDLAMGTFLEYRRDSPLVVEGYATGPVTSVQYLRSEARARTVRDHIVRRFRRDAAITGAIGLAADAQDAPSGNGQWDGIALALHVAR
jgi:phospholipid/cholesterol/gamma-HCH transport system substrate-binding protein